MPEEVIKANGIKDYIENYVGFQEMLINAQSMLDALLAEYNSLMPKQERERELALEVKIANQRTYLSRLKKIIKDWGNALQSLALTYNKTEYEMFNILIIKGVPPKKTKWSQQVCYNFKSKVYKDIDKLTEKKEGF